MSITTGTRDVRFSIRDSAAEVALAAGKVYEIKVE